MLNIPSPSIVSATPIIAILIIVDKPFRADIIRVTLKVGVNKPFHVSAGHSFKFNINSDIETWKTRLD